LQKKKQQRICESQLDEKTGRLLSGQEEKGKD
jgi:hypothetical protein